MNKELKSEITCLVESAEIAILSSVDENGFPNTKGVLALQHDDLFTHYFSTNFSAKRTQQFLKNPKACVYFCDAANRDYKGLMLVGTMRVCTDKKHKTMLWREGFEIYYPDGGVESNDYCVLEFTAERANYYHGLSNTTFSAEEFLNS